MANAISCISIPNLNNKTNRLSPSANVVTKKYQILMNVWAFIFMSKKKSRTAITNAVMIEVSPPVRVASSNSSGGSIPKGRSIPSE